MEFAKMPTQSDRVSQFRDLHARGRILVLPNAWDAASARLVQDAGAKAVATSSAAVAWSNGCADGEGMSREIAIASTQEVLRVVDVPVSVDSEAGYSSDPAEVAQHILRLIEIGVAGVNIEDGKEPPDLLVAKIKAIRSAVKAKGADIFINARTDVYLQNLVPDDRKLGETIRRTKLYTEAGADGIFAAFMTDMAQIREVVAATDLPVNILATKTAPDVATLKAAGVRRLSIGALTARSAYGHAARAVKMLLDDGRYDAIFSTAGDCPDFNKAFG